MKLLFDANLSPRLVGLLADLFPESRHVFDFHEESAEDLEIWETALAQNYTIVTKDSDFEELSTYKKGTVPVVWVRRGNCPTDEIANVLRSNVSAIRSMEDENSVLTVLILL
jgi:predicted nuclease of predicted toxin-antitoxin system